MKNVIIDIRNISNKQEVSSSEQSGDLGELLLPGTSSNSYKSLNESIEVLRSSAMLLDFIPIRSDDSLWKIEIIFHAKDNPQARHAILSCVHKDEYALRISGRTASFRNLEDALTNLMQRGLFVESGNINDQTSLPRY